MGTGGDDAHRAVGALGDRRERQAVAIRVGVVGEDTDREGRPDDHIGRIRHRDRRDIDRDRHRADRRTAPAVAERVGEALHRSRIGQAGGEDDRGPADLRRGTARGGHAGDRQRIAVRIGVVGQHVDRDRQASLGGRRIVDRRGRMIEDHHHGGGGEAAPAVGGGVAKLSRAGGADIPREGHRLGVGADDSDRPGRLRHGTDRQPILVRIGVVGEDRDRRGGPKIGQDGVRDCRRRQVLAHRHVGRGRAAAAVADRIGKGLDRQHAGQRRELDRGAHDRQGSARIGRNRGDRQRVAVDVPVVAQHRDRQGLAGEREDRIRQRHGRRVDGDGHRARRHAAAAVADRVGERVHARRAGRWQVAQRFAPAGNRDRTDRPQIDVRLRHRGDDERIAVRVRVIGQHVDRRAESRRHGRRVGDSQGSAVDEHGHRRRAETAAPVRERVAEGTQTAATDRRGVGNRAGERIDHRRARRGRGDRLDRQAVPVRIGVVGEDGQHQRRGAERGPRIIDAHGRTVHRIGRHADGDVQRRRAPLTGEHRHFGRRRIERHLNRAGKGLLGGLPIDPDQAEGVRRVEFGHGRRHRQRLGGVGIVRLGDHHVAGGRQRADEPGIVDAGDDGRQGPVRADPLGVMGRTQGSVVTHRNPGDARGDRELAGDRVHQRRGRIDRHRRLLPGRRSTGQAGLQGGFSFCEHVEAHIARSLILGRPGQGDIARHGGRLQPTRHAELILIPHEAIGARQPHEVLPQRAARHRRGHFLFARIQAAFK